MELKRATSRLLIVGDPGPVHIGAHLFHAARSLGLSVKLVDHNSAFDASWPIIKFHWWLWGRRPPLLKQFSQHVVEVCQKFQPQWMLSTGISPIADSAIEAIGKLGARRLNYLTDDPWNSAHRSSWFMRALVFYDHIFSPRLAILNDLKILGCSQLSYLPFAYAPEIHFPDNGKIADTPLQRQADVVFAGAADRDRLAYINALIRANFKVALYGGFWERFPETRVYARGLADAATLRKAIGEAKVALCLVRRANRDGNSMRTFEVPAIGGCMLVEDTGEHREIFGRDKEAVVYFQTVDEMIEKLRWLLGHDEERRRLASVAHRLIVQGHNTYADRLKSMLKLAEHNLDCGKITREPRSKK